MLVLDDKKTNTMDVSEESIETPSNDNNQESGTHLSNENFRQEKSRAVVEEENTPELVQRKGLARLGFATALAIAVHNFPEGLVTFVSYMDEPAVGTVLAVGIGIHNIPEGLCVAMPVFYATQSRWKAFCWGILSGVSEPIGALIGYFVLGGSFSGNANGILFSLVSGIMTMLVVDELLPCAHRIDPSNHVVTWSIIVGMAAIALSLVLFAT
jgi:ZIP family zinc transporter